MAKLERGVIDLATLRPDLVKEWHNGNTKENSIDLYEDAPE